ncbi:protein of unknown function [Thermococcus nautili]|nr:protein of unknown function [Thermococcus nautili]
MRVDIVALTVVFIFVPVFLIVPVRGSRKVFTTINMTTSASVAINKYSIALWAFLFIELSSRKC